MARGTGIREDVKQTYQKLAASPEAFCRAAEKHYKDLLESTLRVKTPNKDLDLAFSLGKVAYDNLLVDNPDLGRGLVAGLGLSGTGGRPGFGWFFGSDTYINSLSLNSLEIILPQKTPSLSPGSGNGRTAKWPMSCPRRPGMINWWKDYPYGYIHGDTTPFLHRRAGRLLLYDRRRRVRQEELAVLKKGLCLVFDNGRGR